ncbi:MAG: CBS domain-containing protein [Salinivirgaceae bacterium]|jgi:predicted transcriptional regulator
MIASELISEIVPAVHKDDKASEALNWMDVFRVSHLPIVDNQEYMGLISETDIFDMNNPEIPVLSHTLSIPRPFIYENQHIYEAAELVAKYKLTLIPVLSVDEKYLGVITLTELAQEFSHLMSSDSPGGILVLELNAHDYSLSEIAQIIEGNDAKTLSLYVRTTNLSETVEITLKINRTDLSAVIQTFERYNYKIKAIHSTSKELDSLIKDRLDSFLKYISI